MNLFRLIWQLIQSVIFNRAMNEEIPDDVCVACESEDITVLAEGVYRCNACGYEGGSNFAEYKQQQRRKKVDALEGEARQEHIVDTLKEARTLASSAQGSLSSASASNIQDMLGVGASSYGGVAGQGYEAQEELIGGLRLLMEAEELLDEVAHMTGRELPENLRVKVELGFASSSLDNLGDGMIFDALTASKISKAKTCANRMEQWAQNELQTAPS